MLFGTKGSKSMFDVAARQVIENLVGKDMSSREIVQASCRLIRVEVTYAEGADLSFLPQLRESFERIRQRNGPSPMEQI